MEILIDGEYKDIDDLTIEEQMREYIKCASDPIYFIQSYLQVFDMTQDGEVPFNLFDFQQNLINTYKDNRLVITNKYRQAGVSTTTCAYIAWYVMFNKNRYVAIVADKKETARDEIMKDVVNFIEMTPDFLRPEQRKEDKKSEAHRTYVNGSTIKAFAATKLRGPTPTLIFWDETAHSENGETFWTSAYASISTGGSCIMVSTPNGLDPVFYKTFDQAKNGKSQFVPVELRWYYDPRYTKDLKWIKNDEKTLSNVPRDQYDELIKQGYKPTSTWYEGMCREYKFDQKKINQELECVVGNTLITVKDNITGEIKKISIKELYDEI